MHEGLKSADAKDIAIVRDAITEGIIEIVKVDTNKNHADMMTKPMTVHKLREFVAYYLHD